MSLSDVSVIISTADHARLRRIATSWHADPEGATIGAVAEG